MTCFVLVPGAMHGAWMWARLARLLEAAGHDVIARDLPGMGADRSIRVEDVTLDHWTAAVSEQVVGAGTPVILVGHSRGGLVIGEAAERSADHVLGLIYITALLVPPGRCARDLPGVGDHPLRRDVRRISPLDAAVAIPMFYNRCTPKDAAWAGAQLCPEPSQPLETRVGVSWERWGRVPRAYVECTDDRTVSLERQRAIQALAPCDPVVTIEADHSPFLSEPDKLAAAMDRMARTFVARG